MHIPKTIATAFVITVLAGALAGCISPGLFSKDAALASVQFSVTMEGRAAPPAAVEFSDTFRFAWLERDGLYHAVYDGPEYLEGLSQMGHGNFPDPVRHPVDAHSHLSHLPDGEYPLLVPPTPGNTSWTFEGHDLWAVTAQVEGTETTVHAQSAQGAYTYTYTGKNPLHMRSFRFQAADSEAYLQLDAAPLFELPTGTIWKEYAGGGSSGVGDSTGSFSLTASGIGRTTFVASVNLACDDATVPQSAGESMRFYLDDEFVGWESCPGEPRIRHWTVDADRIRFHGEQGDSLGSRTGAEMQLGFQLAAFPTQYHDFQIGVN